MKASSLWSKVEGLPGQPKLHRDCPLGEPFANPGFVSSRDIGLLFSLVLSHLESQTDAQVDLGIWESGKDATF